MLLPTGPSTSSTKGEYSVCTAATGAILQARWSVVDVTDESPMCLIFPSLLKFRDLHATEGMSGSDVLTIAIQQEPALSLQWAFRCWHDERSLGRKGFSQFVPRNNLDGAGDMQLAGYAYARNTPKIGSK